MPKKPAPAGSSFKLTYSAAPRRAAAVTDSATQSTRPLTSSTWVLTIVGGLFGVFVLLLVAVFVILELA
jgi:hypothetical protein